MVASLRIDSSFNTSAMRRACAVTITTRSRLSRALRQSCTKGRNRPPYEPALLMEGTSCSTALCKRASNSPSAAESIPANCSWRRCCNCGSNWSHVKCAARKCGGFSRSRSKRSFISCACSSSSAMHLWMLSGLSRMSSPLRGR